MVQDFDTIIEEITQKDARYHPDAYEFVVDALHYSRKKFKREKHVSGPELLEGVKQLLVKEFGPMAITVLAYWRVQSTEDIGNIVFNLVEAKILSKDNDDNIESFRDAYDFNSVFVDEYRKQLLKKVSRMR